MKIKQIVIFLISLSLLSGCTSTAISASPSASASELETYQNVSVDAGFDTVLVYQESAKSQEIFNTHFDEAVNLFKYYNSLFDIYNSYDGLNNLKTINDNAGIQPVSVTADIIDMLKKAKQFYEYSNGEFDVTMGNLLRVWHRYREDGIAINKDGGLGKTPTEEELKTAAGFRGWEYVVIDEKASTVYITDPSISLDVGGIAKGYATEQIALKLQSEGVVHGAINAGGNNRTLGAKANGTEWNVRIQNPIGSDNLLIVSEPGEESFVTSGDYERYYTAADGRRYHHIIDPSTDFPADYYHSVSVITKDSGVADCLSTTLFTMNYEDGMKLIESYKEANPDTDVDVIWMADPGKSFDAPNSKTVGDLYIAWTDGLNGRITWG
ncbi:MAG: FAD:protein FMN transferase [Erysipelotrichia bacterium]|nr:FAD:protein FMN transferase [Erysipelotrichia bacterium]